jgi:rare lipoprotein A
MLWSCASSPRFTRTTSSPREKPRAPAPVATSPASSDKSLLVLEGIASYYADDFHGKQAANGEIFNMNDLTAAHRTLPFGTRVKVTNLSNNKTVVVRVIDRGPYVDGRIIDLSLGAARSIGMVESGTAKVRIAVLQWGKGELFHNR